MENDPFGGLFLEKHRRGMYAENMSIALHQEENNNKKDNKKQENSVIKSEKSV